VIESGDMTRCSAIFAWARAVLMRLGTVQTSRLINSAEGEYGCMAEKNGDAWAKGKCHGVPCPAILASSKGCFGDEAEHVAARQEGQAVSNAGANATVLQSALPTRQPNTGGCLFKRTSSAEL
jgi:hypothetical protein